MSKKQQPKAVQPTPEAQAKLRALLAQAQSAQQTFKAYAEGVLGGMGLDGAWDLNVQTMTFSKEPASDSAGEAGSPGEG